MPNSMTMYCLLRRHPEVGAPVLASEKDGSMRPIASVCSARFSDRHAVEMCDHLVHMHHIHVFVVHVE